MEAVNKRASTVLDHGQRPTHRTSLFQMRNKINSIKIKQHFSSPSREPRCHVVAEHSSLWCAEKHNKQRFNVLFLPTSQKVSVTEATADEEGKK